MLTQIAIMIHSILFVNLQGNTFFDVSVLKLLIRFNSIPQNIEARIMEFMVTTWQQTKGIDTNAVVNLCPKDLKADICVHLHR